MTTNDNFLKVASFSFRSENPPPRQKELPRPFGLLMAGSKRGKEVEEKGQKGQEASWLLLAQGQKGLGLEKNHIFAGIIFVREKRSLVFR